MPEAGKNWFFRSLRGSILAAAVFLAWDGALTGSFTMSVLFCPLWFVISLLKAAIERPGWGLALVRIGFPAATLGLVLANNSLQLRIAEANARRVIVACEAYHAAHGDFPRKLDDLVPEYLKSVPPAKHCLMGAFAYHYSGSPMLYWQVVPPFDRKIYRFETRSWSRLD